MAAPTVQPSRSADDALLEMWRARLAACSGRRKDRSPSPFRHRTSGMKPPSQSRQGRDPATVVVTGYFGDRLAEMCER